MEEMDKGDVEVIMVKIDYYSGFLGAGKTTLIKNCYRMHLKDSRWY